MKISRAYMKGTEFVERQAWLPFVDATGVVLQVLEPVKAEAWAWFRKWKKTFRSKVIHKTVRRPQQLELWSAFTINQYRLI